MIIDDVSRGEFCCALLTMAFGALVGFALGLRGEVAGVGHFSLGAKERGIARVGRILLVCGRKPFDWVSPGGRAASYCLRRFAKAAGLSGTKWNPPSGISPVLSKCLIASIVSLGACTF